MKILLLFTLIFTAGLLFGQTAFEKWKAEQEQKFNEFKENEDSRFAKFLEDEWRRFQVFKGVEFDKEPKIDIPPVAVIPSSDESSSSLSQDNGSDEIEDKELPGSEAADVETDNKDDADDLIGVVNSLFGGTDADEPANTSAEGVNNAEPPSEGLVVIDNAGSSVIDENAYDFFGIPLYPNEIEIPSKASRINEKGIAKFWMSLSEAGADELASWITETSADLKLGGWGTGVLAKMISAEVYPDSVNESRMLCWYLMVKAGFDVRVGYNNGSVFLLIPSKATLYETAYYNINGINYYMHDFISKPSNFGNLYIYENTFSSDLTYMNFDVKIPPKLGSLDSSRFYRFKFKGKSYSGRLHFNLNLVDYYKVIPHTDMDVYFNFSLSKELLDSVSDEFSGIIAGLNQEDAVAFLLRFVQTSFDYETDQEQFGYEKWMFAEESLYYEFIDCEDRSILFSALVTNMLDMKVIGLDWPGHIAAAVHFTTAVSGTYITYGGKRYYICDPTYINAGIGMIMPQYEGEAVKFIIVE